jgi:hypothetical protein
MLALVGPGDESGRQTTMGWSSPSAWKKWTATTTIRSGETLSLQHPQRTGPATPRVRSGPRGHGCRADGGGNASPCGRIEHQCRHRTAAAMHLNSRARTPTP